MLRAMPVSHYAAVVFLKIQDFARRSASEQARLRAQLQAVIAVTAAEMAPAQRVVLDAADGAAIVVLDHPRAALRLAERSLSAVAVGLPLSAGLNYGAVQLSGEGMTGDGIAAAASVAAFAPPERVLATRAFREALGNAEPGMDAALVPAGTFNDPGLRAHEVFRPSAKALARRRWRYGAVTALVAVALLAGGVVLREAAPERQPFVDVVIQKTEPYWRDLVQRVSY